MSVMTWNTGANTSAIFAKSGPISSPITVNNISPITLNVVFNAGISLSLTLTRALPRPSMNVVATSIATVSNASIFSISDLPISVINLIPAVISAGTFSVNPFINANNNLNPKSTNLGINSTKPSSVLLTTSTRLLTI